MRPRRLELEGFTAFKDTTVISFEDLDLFAITGPTGAGKSSLIDAICYALYGKVPRVTTEVGSLVSADRDRMRVALEFSADDQRYRVFRETRVRRRQAEDGVPAEVRTTGQGNVRIERCEGGEWLPAGDRARDVNAQVAEIVGLDYDGFTRSVILPQGQFQEFLAGSAEKRRAVLRSLLRLEVYDRMRQRASGMSGELKTRLEERRRVLEELSEATPENVERLDGERQAALAQVAALKDQVEALDTAMTSAVAVNHARETLSKREAEAQEALLQYGRTKQLVDEGDAGVRRLDEALEGLRKSLEANVYDPAQHQALGVALERVKALSQTRGAIAQTTKAFEDASRQAANAGATAEKAQTAHEAAETAMHEAEEARAEAQRHNLAASVQQGLKIGDPCPVCGEKITKLVAHKSSDLDAAEKRFAAARKAEADARGSLMNASRVEAKASSDAQAFEKQLEGFAERIREQEGEVEEVLPVGVGATVAAVSAALNVQQAALQEKQALERDLKAAQADRDTKQAALAGAQKEMAALEVRNLAAAEALEAAESALETARTALEQALGERWPEAHTALREGRDVALVLKRRQTEAQQERDGLQHRAGQLETRVERMKQDLDRAKTLREELTGMEKQWNVATDLAQMLGAAKFQQFLQYEALQTLARDGSKRLEELSSGRYTLQIDDKGAEFEVIDQWNADQSRSVKTLSGGETFLASLALSLALAESLPGLAASRRVVLDSIFLDEGFGSLDPDALERAAEALDALRSEERMVCVVTHLQELAQRLPARIVVTKTESGSTVAVV
jgi:exonuclease SbcC